MNSYSLLCATVHKQKNKIEKKKKIAQPIKIFNYYFNGYKKLK